MKVLRHLGHNSYYICFLRILKLFFSFLFLSQPLVFLQTSFLSTMPTFQVCFDFSLLLLDLSWFSWFFPLFLFLPLFSILKALIYVLHLLFLLIFSLMITPKMSSNTNVFALETYLLTTMTKLSHLFCNEHKIKRAQTS